MALDAQSVRYGYGDRLEPIAASEVSVSQNRIEYQHKRAGAPGPELVEWYVNRPHGIEHGFTLSRPLEAHRDGGPLHLALRMTGDLQAKAAAHGAIAFTAGAEGTVLRYDELHVFDATGKELAASLDITGNRLSLLVDDSTAVYPIIIDPILYSETKLIAGDGTADDILGFSVASDGSTVVVGAPGDHYPDNSSNLTAVGSVYVYERSGGGFVEHAHLTTDVYSSAFGYDVAIDGDRIVVGDPYSGPGATGSMRVYVRKGDKWTLEDRITFDASSGDALHPGIRFSVDIDGDTIVAGSPFYRPPPYGVTPYPDNYIGTVRVFVPRGDGGPSGLWVEQAQLTASNGADGDAFGTAVAILGDTIVVGAPHTDSPAGSGSVYVYTRTGNVWTELSQLFASDAAFGDAFGTSVDISGTTFIVGAPLDDTADGPNAGSVYVYGPGPFNWVEQAHLFASDGAANDLFGNAVALSAGSVAVVGAPLDNTPAGTNAGSAYVFIRAGFAWNEQAHLFASDGAAEDQFGASVAVDFTTFRHRIVVGAPGANSVGRDAGAAYVYRLQGTVD